MPNLKINSQTIITESGGTVTYNAPFNGTITSTATFPAGHIIRTNHKYILKDHYSSATKSWQTAETHTDIMTGLTNGNKLRVFFDGFKIISQQGSYAYALFSVYPSGTTDSLTNATGKKMLISDYINSQSRGYLGTMTIEITVAASAYDCKLYYMTEDIKCAPNKKYRDGSCFTLDDLQLMAESYNNLDGNLDQINISNNKK